MNYIEPPRQYLKRHRAMPRCAAVESNAHGSAAGRMHVRSAASIACAPAGARESMLNHAAALLMLADTTCRPESGPRARRPHTNSRHAGKK